MWSGRRGVGRRNSSDSLGRVWWFRRGSVERGWNVGRRNSSDSRGRVGWFWRGSVERGWSVGRRNGSDSRGRVGWFWRGSVERGWSVGRRNGSDSRGRVGWFWRGSVERGSRRFICERWCMALRSRRSAYINRGGVERRNRRDDGLYSRRRLRRRVVTCGNSQHQESQQAPDYACRQDSHPPSLSTVKAYCVLSAGAGVVLKSFAAPVYLVARVALAWFTGRRHTEQSRRDDCVWRRSLCVLVNRRNSFLI